MYFRPITAIDWGKRVLWWQHALWDVATKVPLFFAAPNIPQNKVLDQPVELVLLSIYPILSELCGLPPNSKNEGKSLIPFSYETSLDMPIAVPTFGRNNHSIKSLYYRYIRYEDGGEKLYDHTLDPNEFNNLATNDAYKRVLMDLKKYLPKYNARWDEKSNYTFQPFFVGQEAKLNLMR